MRVCDYCTVCIHTTSTPGISYAYILYTRLSAFRVDRPRRKKKAIKMHSTGASLMEYPAKCGGLDYFAYRMTDPTYCTYSYLLFRTVHPFNMRGDLHGSETTESLKKQQVPVSRLRISRTIACFFSLTFSGTMGGGQRLVVRGGFVRHLIPAYY